jgi:predicted ATPase
LTGPGGVGKTRLALRIANELSGAFPGGVYLVQLSAARDADDLVAATAAGLGLPAPAAGTFAERIDWLVSQLRGRLLLILDTCEHLVNDCAALADAVLRGTDRPVVLVTGRQPLHVPGEVVFRIPPFAVPDDAGQGDDAVALFADRLRRHRRHAAEAGADRPRARRDPARDRVRRAPAARRGPR